VRRILVLGPLIVLSVACFDDTIQPKNEEAGTSQGLVPAGAVTGGTKSIAGTNVTVWAKLDAEKKVTDVGWNVPLALISTIASEFDYRESVLMPQEVVDQVGWHGTTFDYLPKGHAPPGVYDTPHWEFHIFYPPEAEFNAIDCKEPTPPPDDTLPDHFAMIPPPDNCTPMMGVHAIDVLSPEFNQERFTKSHTMSYYKATLSALEPKMTREVLLARQTFSFDVPRVKKSLSGKRYPAKFMARYEASGDHYELTYSEFSVLP
jgi:hypothetical protein